MSGPDIRPDTRTDTRREVIESADRTQRLASDPMASVFVSASAGSGKTKLLIDRLLRLMLPLQRVTPEGDVVLVEGSDPSRILCLTYTKAAAAEMANRLQARLGRWVSLTDEALGQQLTSLDVPDTAETRGRARSLFLKVLDLPGGLRIETIHAFCQSLLRRFPLEAAVDPHFALMEDTDTTRALRDAMEYELGVAPELAADVAGTVGIDDFFARVRDLNAEGSRLETLLRMWRIMPDRVAAVYRKALGVGRETVEDIEDQIRTPPDEPALREELRRAVDVVTPAKRPVIEAMLDWLGTGRSARDPELWTGMFLTDKGTVRVMSGLVSKAAQKVVPDLPDMLTREGERVHALRQALRAVRLVALNRALLGLSVPLLEQFAREKTAHGLVDYNDLILRTRNLLDEPGAAWVLYKLDGGIDHLLLDEVQDTSALQWQIAGMLTAEFFSGEGAHEETPRPRTVFAVGDFKQSIYGFQGADPDQFHHWRRVFADRVRQAGLLWRDPGLNVSFRSVTPVLEVVDAVFAQPLAAHGLHEEGHEGALPRHVSARPGQGGRVELWPLVPVQEGETAEETDGETEISPWRAPHANTGQRTAPQRLAEALAAWIGAQIGRSPQPGQPALGAGDVLVLVPRRSQFLRALVRELKSRGVPVATLVRVGLTDQVAVRDLMTLCSALLLPQDDLTLASVLTSPLGGVSDDSLMALATRNGSAHALGRDGAPLWSVLRDRHRERPEWHAAWEMLSALYARVDYATPYRLLAEALGQHGGRTRLLQRLGAEAAEPVDELLSAALRYEGLHPPSLQGFLHWLEASEASSKREAESEMNAVRVMTVHGSKGLQARLVVLPDTTSAPRRDSGFLWQQASGAAGDMTAALDVPLWVPAKDCGTALTEAMRAAATEADRAERNRLLYVALTRASDWLVICGWQPGTKLDDTCWYKLCETGFQTVEAARPEPLGLGWDGDRTILEEARSVPARVAPDIHDATFDHVGLPDWLGRAPDWRVVRAPVEDALTRPLAPSRPDGIEFGPLPASRSPLDLVEGRNGPARVQAMRRGTMIHRLLQLLPDTAPAMRANLAASWLSRPAWGLEGGEVARLVEQVLGIVEHPDLAPLFAPGSRAEQPVSGVSRGRVVLGQVDRLSVGPRDVWVCDYKTNRTPPGRVERTPVAYLRQMAAYRDVLRQLYPDHAVHCALVWTEGAKVVTLPSALLDTAG